MLQNIKSYSLGSSTALSISQIHFEKWDAASCFFLVAGITKHRKKKTLFLYNIGRRKHSHRANWKHDRRWRRSRTVGPHHDAVTRRGTWGKWDFLEHYKIFVTTLWRFLDMAANLPILISPPIAFGTVFQTTGAERNVPSDSWMTCHSPYSIWDCRRVAPVICTLLAPLLGTKCSGTSPAKITGL